MKISFIREQLQKNNCDAYLLINHENSGQPSTAFLSGFGGSESVVLITQTGQYIFVDGRYFTRVGTEAPDFQMEKATRGRVYDDIKRFAEAHNLKSFILDPTITWYTSIVNLNSKLPGVGIEAIAGFLNPIREMKNEKEIAILQESAKIACAAFNQLTTEITAGKTERWIAARLEYLMKEMGADRYSFDTIVASGTNGAFPHYVPSDKKVAEGELVTIDWGCYYKGYASDMTRTVAIGKVSDKLLDIYNTVKASQQAGLDAACSHLSGKELDMVCRKVITDAGYGEYFLHGTGHGLGMDVHESPYVNSNNESLLPVNCVVSVEPGIYIAGIGGVRIEDCVVIKENGSLNLNDGVTKELIVL